MTARRIASRLAQSAVTLAVLSFAVYGLIGLMPGDPVDLMMAGNPDITPDDMARLRALHGLDQPLAARYADWATRALSGDLGYSRLYGLPVLDVIGPRLLNTLALLGAALTVTLLAAVPLGVLAAKRQGEGADRLIRFFSLAGISLPPFWLGILLITLFSVTLGWLPAGADFSGDAATKLTSAILPVLTLAVAGAAVYIRHLRGAMIEALSADHIRTARAKGCSPARAVWGHAFKSALPPVVTLMMLDLGTLVGGALTVETVFGWPGMGKLMFDAIMGNDYNLALAGFLILSACVLLANALADACYGLLDPRVRDRAGAGA